VLATAAPTISTELQSANGYIWIAGVYLLTTAAGTPIWAKLSDIWGRKLILLIVVALFFGSSIVCALAVDMAMLLAGRIFQGTAGGAIIQLVSITISDIFSMRCAPTITTYSYFHQDRRSSIAKHILCVRSPDVVLLFYFDSCSAPCINDDSRTGQNLTCS
jgi:MFS family permease